MDNDDVDSIDLDEMMEAIRQEVAERRAANPFTSAAPRDQDAELTDDWSEIAGLVGDASRMVQMNTELPDTSGKPLIKRVLLLRLGRVIMGQIHHLRERQTSFNRSVAAALKVLAAREQNLESIRLQVERLADAQARLELDLRNRVDEVIMQQKDLQSRLVRDSAEDDTR